eukprot:CAMPEP_0185844846 /NCGR_PEP_ID=MMETSP1354-20130828/946_1 /TAXON_ID=708628 /ORGANISM="Erythrolobus madagascarensis, Strain CCMP3276" /LENGTH=240 /DNA_ID=CAMNT_0028544641 /DNA_START=80 /DNA_END=802 /DNA_ORIENTATION=-
MIEDGSLVVFGEFKDHEPLSGSTGYALPWEREYNVPSSAVTINRQASGQSSGDITKAWRVQPTIFDCPEQIQQLDRLGSVESLSQKNPTPNLKRKKPSGSEVSSPRGSTGSPGPDALGAEVDAHEESKSTKAKAPPARFCHLCWRKAGVVANRTIELFPCSGYERDRKICRKVECDRCLVKHAGLEGSPEIEQDFFIETVRHGTRSCLHCQKICPPTAQCNFYAKANKKRKDLRLRRKYH